MKHTEDFESLFTNATICILAVDRHGCITMVNPFLLKQFGYKNARELVGKKVEILIPPHLILKHISHREQYNKNPQNRPMGMGKDLLALKKDGTLFPVEISLSHYIKEKKPYTFAFVTDISRFKELEQGILFLNEQLQQAAVEFETRVEERTYELTETIHKLDLQIKETEEAKSKLLRSEEELQELLKKEKDLNLLKSNFVATASHEFRTPLSSILSSVYLLSKYTSTEDQPKRDRHIERITSSVTLLTDILNDFLSVGKIEEGKVQVQWNEFNLNRFIADLLEDMRSVTKKEQVFSFQHNGEQRVCLDATLLKHIMMNLISNAIKYSPAHATIEIASFVENEKITLRIKDKGIGISKEDQKHLFERFYRASNAANIQGTGLGLHIVSKYVEMMHGEITCNSDLQKGTEFIIKFGNRTASPKQLRS